MQKIKVTKERKVITYSDLWRTSEFLLKRGTEEELGSYYMFLSCLMFQAFSLEAFLNHMGEKLFETWGELEKPLSPKAKLGLICEKLKLNINYGKTPWQIVPELIGFRNKVAHGKSELLKSEEIVLGGSDKYEKLMHKFLMAEWQEFANKKNAQRAKKQLEALFIEVHRAANMENDFLFEFGAQFRTAKLVQE